MKINECKVCLGISCPDCKTEDIKKEKEDE